MDFWLLWKTRKVVLQTELCPWKFIIKALAPSMTVFRDRTFKEVIKVNFMGNRWGTVLDFIFLGSKITADGDCSHEIKRRLLLGRKVMTT